jgi:hypothetical protein
MWASGGRLRAMEGTPDEGPGRELPETGMSAARDTLDAAEIALTALADGA